MKIKFLGTASNGGVPQFDCRCNNCQRARINKRIARLRSSLAVAEVENEWFILDCGPDFNNQLAKLNILIQDVKGIGITHLHADHSSGLSEMGFGKCNEIKVLASSGLKKEILQNNFLSYLFEAGFARFAKDSLVRFVPIKHWPEHDCSAIVFGNKKRILFAPDCAEIDKPLLDAMKTVDLIIFDGTFLNESKHNHLSIRESCQQLVKTGKRVIFTHINHSENPKEVELFIKKFDFELADDGLEINI